MALREILKTDTSAKTQAALSASHRTEVTQSDATIVEKIKEKDESGSTDLTESEKDNTGENDTKLHEDATNAKDETIELDKVEDAVKQ